MRSRFLKALAFFFLSYVFLYLLYVFLDFLPKWDAFGYSFLKGIPISGYAYIDPLFLGIPIVGFALMWLGMDAYLHHFKDRFVLSVPFALVFVAASYFSFFLALMGYFWNNAFLVALSQGKPDPGFSSFGITLDFVLKEFMNQLLKSPFFVFVLAALLGWFSFVVIHSFFGEALPGHPAHQTRHSSNVEGAPSSLSSIPPEAPSQHN